MEGGPFTAGAAPFPQKGSGAVEAGYPKYRAPGDPEPGGGGPLEHGRLYINRGPMKDGSEGQYFDRIEPVIWETQIGGYRVCEKWLKDRRIDKYGQPLTFNDIQNYQKVVTVIAETIRLQQEIDETIDSYGGWPLR